MKRSSGNGKRRVWAVLASAAVAALGVRSAVGGEITSTWSGNSGNWTDPTQWSTNPNYPNNGTPSGTTYDAVINAPGAGAYTVTLNSNIATDSVTLDSPNATLLQTGGNLTTGSLNIMAGTYSFMGQAGPFLSSSFDNAGTVEAVGGGTLHFSPTNFDNTNGTITASPNSEVVINPATNSTPPFTPGQLGNLVNNGGTIVLAGDLQNSGNTLTFGGQTGTWELAGIIQGGVLNLPLTTILEGIQLQNVTLACDLTQTGNFGSLSIGGLNAAGHSINIFGNQGELYVGGPATTLSNIMVNLGGSTSNARGGYLPGAVAFAPTTQVNGWGGVGLDGFGNRTTSLNNQGVVRANVSGETLQVSPTLLTNAGTLAAAEGGILNISPAGSTSWTNNGVLSVDSLSTITVNQNLSFADGSAFDAILGSNGAAGVLSITGSLDLSHDEFLNLSLAPGAVFSTPYEIVSYTGTLTGTFENVTPGFVVDYSQPGEILVTAVPEPACGFLLSALGILLARRRGEKCGVGNRTPL